MDGHSNPPDRQLRKGRSRGHSKGEKRVKCSKMEQEYTIKDSVLWIRPRPAGSTASTNKTRPQTRPGALRHFFNVVKYPEKRRTWLAFGRTKSRECRTSHYTVYIKKHLTGDGLAFGYYAKPLILNINLKT